MNPIMWLHPRVDLAADSELTIDFAIPDAGDSAEEWELFGTPGFNPDSNGAVTANATNYVSVALKNGSTELYTMTTASTGLTANTRRAMTDASAAPTAKEFTAGTDRLTLAITMPGTGAALKGVFDIGLRRKQAQSYYT